MVSDIFDLGIPSHIIKSFGSGPYDGNSVITVICSCGSLAELKVNSVKRTIKRVGYYRCLSCGMKAKHADPDFKSKHATGVKTAWTDQRRINQSLISKSLWSSDEYKLKITTSATESWSDRARRDLATSRAISLWKDNEFRSLQSKITDSDDFRSKVSEGVKKSWQDFEYREKQHNIKSSSEYLIKQKELALMRFNDPEYRNNIIESLKDYWDDPRSRLDASARAILLWSDPSYREKQLRIAIDPDYIKARSERAKEQWKDPIKRHEIIKGIKEVWKDPEFKKRASEISRRRWENDDYRKNQAIKRSEILLNGRDSILERTVQTLLDALKIQYVRHHPIGFYEFDVFIPSANLLIECNGECFSVKNASIDSAKFSYIDKYFPELKVLYLWERDFMNPNLIRQKLVRAIFGSDDEQQEIYNFKMSELNVKPMNLKEKVQGSYYSAAEEFLQSFHYAGYGRSAKCVLGVYLKDILIGICKFCSPIRKEVATSMGLSCKSVLELDRFALHPSYQKKNLASWFISRCTRYVLSEYPGIRSLVSFADSTFGHIGTIYKASNWAYVHQVPKDYHYISPEGFVVHKKTLYDSAVRNGLKESDYAEKYGYVKAESKTKIKYRYDRKRL